MWRDAARPRSIVADAKAQRISRGPPKVPQGGGQARRAHHTRCFNDRYAPSIGQCVFFDQFIVCSYELRSRAAARPRSMGENYEPRVCFVLYPATAAGAIVAYNSTSRRGCLVRATCRFYKYWRASRAALTTTATGPASEPASRWKLRCFAPTHYGCCCARTTR